MQEQILRQQLLARECLRAAASLRARHVGEAWWSSLPNRCLTERTGQGFRHVVFSTMSLANGAAADLALVFALIFGGCCSNALALELTTRQLPSSGALITLAQFVVVTLVAYAGEARWARVGRVWVPWVRRPGVPLRRWAVQVVLYFATSMLNNIAFAYNIPMAVHIVFRSGGMIVNMALGWAIDKKRYSLLQVASVCLVTIGVVVATLSAALPADGAQKSVREYAVGVGLLSIALLASGFMGLFQERTYALYGRQHWHEALFYSHLFSLPLFALQRRSLVHQIHAANATPRECLGLCARSPWGIKVPSYYTKLALNVGTQLVCINGVNRLTARVSSLGVSLVLVVRKATSLVISVVLLNGEAGSLGLWGGAAAVMLGTLGYTYGGMQPKAKTA